MIRRVITIASVVALLTPAAFGILTALAPPAGASPPTISSVEFRGGPSAPTVYISGSGFGTEGDLGAPEDPGCMPQTGNDFGENLILRDTSQGWAGGEGPGDCIGLIISSYSDTEIVYSLGSFYGPPSYVLASGDNYEVDVLGATVTGTVAYTPAPGAINTVVGTGIVGAAGDGGPAKSAQLATPYAIAFDAEGNQIIADVDNERVRVVANSPTNPGYPLAGCTGACVWNIGDIFTIAGVGAGGDGGDGVPATTAHVDTPSSVAVDQQGNVLITDTDTGWVRVLAMSASNPGYPLGSDCGSGSDPCVWTQGDLFNFAPSTGIGITVDAHDNTVFSQGSEIQVVAISATNPGYPLGGPTWTQGQIFTIAGDNSDLPGFNGDGQDALLTDVNNPQGIAIDAQGNAIFSDATNARIRVVAVSASNPGYTLDSSCDFPANDPCTWTAGDVYTIAGTGSTGNNSDEDGLLTTNHLLSFPNGVTIDSQGNPIIADPSNHDIEVIAVSASNPGYALSAHCGGGNVQCTWSPGNVYTIAGLLPPNPGFSGDGGQATDAQVNNPESVALDASGNVYIADSGNAVVREITLATFTVPANPGSANGFDTGYVSSGSVTLSASGVWNNNGTDSGPEGNPGTTTGSFLLPSAPAGALVARIGTSGAWTWIGSGPSTVNGTGTLYLAMNDDPADFVNDTGSIGVTIDAAETVSSGYDHAGPILAGTTLGWTGDITNDLTVPQTNVTLLASAGTPQEAPLTWSALDPELVVQRSGSCSFFHASLYSCSIGTLPAGWTAEAATTFSTAGIEPQTLSDQLLMASDQARTDAIRPLGVTAPQNQVTIDGLLFNVPVPASVVEGTPLSVSGTLTNTSATQTIHGATVSGTISIGSFTSVPSGCQITNDTPLGSGASYTCPTPFDLGPGVTVPGAVTVDTTGLGGRTIDYTASANSPDIGGESYIAVGNVPVLPQPASVQIPATNAPVSASITAGSDAGWTVAITNSTNFAAVGVTVTLDATATAPNTVTTPLTFDQVAINTSLGLPAFSSTCALGAGNTVVCTLPFDIPAHSVQSFSALAITTGLTPASTITGDITTSASNANPSSGTLGTVTVSSTCTTNCTSGVASPGDPFVGNPSNTANQTQQVLVLSSNAAGSSALPPVSVTLQSITPSSGETASDQKLCPTASGQTHCSGQISSITAQFGRYVNQQNPIRVTIVSRWGAAVPAGQILMEKNVGGDPIFLTACVVNPTTRAFNTPCVLPELVRGSAADHNLTTYDTVLFTGLDIHFARRVATGGTKILPPAAPTTLTATAGVLKATLHWKAPTVTNGAGVTGYVVTVLSAGKVVKTVTYGTAALTQIVTGLKKGVSYTFKVAAKNVAGTGAASVVSKAVTPT